MFKYSIKQAGFSLVEVLVVSAVMLVVFGGLFASIEYTLKLVSQSRASLTALSLATDRMEYIRSLSYDDVGTVSGIPNGAIPQNRSVSLNDINFNERVLIEYIDDPADGTGASDSNGVLADYKKVKVEYTWTIGGVTDSFFMISNIVPRSIETTSGGGSLRVNVFDANVSPLSGIDVRLLNETTTSTIDVTRSTDASGIALFTGAPAGSEYQIFVSASGYSSDQTYQATTSLPNPTTQPIAILEGDVSTMNFQVDRLSNLDIKFQTNKVTDSRLETFSNLTGMDTVSSTTINSGELVLTDVSGVYDLAGYVLLDPLTPSPLLGWGIAEFDFNQPANTSVKVQFYTSTSSSDIIPDSDLSGNSAGFTQSIIDLRDLPVLTYPTLVAKISLTTLDTAVTPTVDNFNIFYVESISTLNNTSVDIRGNKTIGTWTDLTPVYKYDISTTTDGSGEVSLSDIEWGGYVIDVSGAGYDIAEACDVYPVTLSPNTSTDLTLTLETDTADTLRVLVQDNLNQPIINAYIELERASSVVASGYTGWCGQLFLSGQAEETDYKLTVSADGFTTEIVDPLVISDDVYQVVTLTP